MEKSSRNLLKAIAQVRETPFPQLLEELLIAHQGNKSDLYEFIFENGSEIEKTSMYRYFNPSSGVKRIPSEDFLGLFASYIGLSEEEMEALLLLRQLKRSRRYGDNW